jgi:hypothetical protein
MVAYCALDEMVLLPPPLIVPYNPFKELTSPPPIVEKFAPPDSVLCLPPPIMEKLLFLTRLLFPPAITELVLETEEPIVSMILESPPLTTLPFEFLAI